MFSAISSRFSLSRNRVRTVDPVAAAHLDAARQRMIEASHRIIDLLPNATEQLDPDNSRKIAKELIVVLGGIGAIDMYTDRSLRKAIFILRKQFSIDARILAMPQGSEADNAAYALPTFLGLACSLGVDASGTETSNALAGGLDIGAIGGSHSVTDR